MPDQKLAKIRTLEELSLNALPGLQQILDDGWILRLSEGYTKRANSVTPLYSSTQDLLTKIARCEKIYRSFNLSPIFRLANIPQLAALDRNLAQLGYLKQDSVSVQVKTIVDLKFPTHEFDITLEPELSQEWLDHFVHAADLPTQYWHTLSTILEIIPHPTCYAYLKDRHRFCSCGLGVLERNYLGLFYIVTTKKQRRQGYAKQLISAMLNWGQRNGASQAYLQVETKNLNGINLYNKLGFTEVYQYFYRLKS
ncbi:MAG: GNAT family N-acetyltransferase [Cyanobacteria bacterium P01_E01_bin.35]